MMYEATSTGLWFYPNPLNKLSPRDKLKFNVDGSLTLYFQHESPGEDKPSQLAAAPRRVLHNSQHQRRQPPYFGGVCSNGSLVYRSLSISITSATLPSGLRNGNGFPVYLCEIGSM